MRSALKTFLAIVFFCFLCYESEAQTTAFTSDGRKVLLYPDGTWKYVFEDDGKKVILNPDGTWKYEGDTTTAKPAVVPPIVAVGAMTMPVDSVVKAPVKPPVKKAPLNLDCSYLVAVERSIQGDKWVAQSKTIKVFTDSTEGFSVSFYKSKNGPLIWTTALNAKGHCIKEEGKMMIVMNDGTRFQVVGDGKPNCDGTFKLYFGGTYGHEIQSDAMKAQGVSALRVWTSNSFVEENFNEDHSALFKAAFNCMLSTK